MAWKRVAAKSAVVVLIATNVATVVWAGCWSYPYQKPRLSYCDGYVEYRYRPDPPFECGFYFNPFQGCREHIVSLDKVIVTWSEPGCTGTEENKQAYYNVGTIHRDENYVCGDTS